MCISSRPVWGAWIEISITQITMAESLGRAPYGARGLKSSLEFVYDVDPKSRPVWGAWIEISWNCGHRCTLCQSRPVWGAWIEIHFAQATGLHKPGSRPVWGAWIEIHTLPRRFRRTPGSRPVWGAWIEMGESNLPGAGFARRAPYGARGLKCACVALPFAPPKSRPVWGAWIEICALPFTSPRHTVAPRMGRVD